MVFHGYFQGFFKGVALVEIVTLAPSYMSSNYTTILDFKKFLRLSQKTILQSLTILDNFLRQWE